MPQGANERSPLLDQRAVGLGGLKNGNGSGSRADSHERASLISSNLSKEEQALAYSAVGERLPYNDYTTIDWLHDLTKDAFRWRALRSNRSLRGRLYLAWDACQGWIAAALIGCLTACVAFCVDVAEVSVSDYKTGYCSTNIFYNQEVCCKSPGAIEAPIGEDCEEWKNWSSNYWAAFAIYVGIAILYGIISGSVTMTTKTRLPSSTDGGGSDTDGKKSEPTGKYLYMAAGSGIPEIKTVLSGFVIPGFLDLRVLFVKAFGAVFAVATGMCLGKEGPFVHISTCVGWFIANLFPKYRENGRKMREMLSVACSAGLSVAFGAPIGGVLFSYEEISTYFPRYVLWKAFLCSLSAAVVLRMLNPTGTGKLILFETNYGTNYSTIHYLVFVLLGVVGGVGGGLFCKANLRWSRTFRKYSIIRDYPVFEVFLVVLVTALLQFPNPLIREPGDIIIKNLLVDCRYYEERHASWVCQQEASDDKSEYIGWLIYGMLAKLLLTTITFGCKVPSGIIIPALDAGALFGRLIGLAILPPTTATTGTSPGIFAMVGAAAFLAGFSRMTVSLAVIMFELTGEVNYVPPFMIAILVAKWVADSISSDGVYDIAQAVLGHPFLDADVAMQLVKTRGATVEELVPPDQTMGEITVVLEDKDFRVEKRVLRRKLALLKGRGLMDGGVVFVNGEGHLHGYLGQAELEFVVGKILYGEEDGATVDMKDSAVAAFVDHTPMMLNLDTPLEIAVEVFGRLGLRYLVILDSTGKVRGLCLKKRLVSYLEGLGEGR